MICREKREKKPRYRQKRKVAKGGVGDEKSDQLKNKKSAT
jgi:hypothetical protein